MALPSRLAVPRPLAATLLVAGLAGSLGLGGCAGTTSYEQMQRAKPTGSAFSQALYRNYAELARSLGMADAPATNAFDSSGSISMSGVAPDVAEVGNAYAAKAITAAKGEEPLPEAAPTDSIGAQDLRMKLLRALDKGRTKAPALAARTQADYDCWILNGTVDALARSAAVCKRAFDSELTHLQHTPGVALQAPAPAKPAAPAESSNPDEQVQ